MFLQLFPINKDITKVIITIPNPKSLLTNQPDVYQNTIIMFSPDPSFSSIF